MNCDLAYFRSRASEERFAALQAEHPKARRIHVAMADCYDEVARALADKERKLQLESAES